MGNHLIKRFKVEGTALRWKTCSQILSDYKLLREKNEGAIDHQIVY